MISIVIPAFNEEKNLQILYKSIKKEMRRINEDYEILFIDDNSKDRTLEIISTIAKRDRRVKAIKFSRNFGSHNAIYCGLMHAKGEGVVTIAADMQDPPEMIHKLWGKWQKGFDVVWATRDKRLGESILTLFFAKVFYIVMRKIIGINEIPENGADFFLIDRKVIDALKNYNERNLHLMNLICWIGFKQTAIPYTKQPRIHGVSGWSFAKKINFFLDSIISFSHLPLRIMSLLGVLLGTLGFIYLAVVFYAKLTGNVVSGWSSLMAVILLISGFQFFLTGMMGEYLWRTLEQSRSRPKYIIEKKIGVEIDFKK